MPKHRCKTPAPKVDTNRWLGTYGDMVTLLMAFFVMLFAVSETNVQKFEAFVSGLAAPFDNPAFELGLVTGVGVEQSHPHPVQLIAPSQPDLANIRTVATTTLLNEEGVEGQAAHLAAAEDATRDQLAQVESEITDVLADIDLPITAELRMDERGLVVSISTDDVLFETGSAVVSQVGRALIAELAPVLVDAPNHIVVEGHTDDRPINRAGYTNWNLSTDRAVAVVHLLGEDHGLPFHRVSAGGYGEFRPLVPNDTPDNRATNRRVEILVVGLDSAEDLTASTATPPPAAPADQVPADQVPADQVPADQVPADQVPASGFDPAGPTVDFSEPLPVRNPGTPIASILGRPS